MALTASEVRKTAGVLFIGFIFIFKDDATGDKVASAAFKIYFLAESSSYASSYHGIWVIGGTYSTTQQVCCI